MIESRYWKEELVRIARSLKRVKQPPRWTERSHCIVERDMMIGFFILRRLIELAKVSSLTREMPLELYSWKAKGEPVTHINNIQLDRLYDVENEKRESKRPLYVANQFMHAYTSFVVRDETRNWSDALIVSDFDRNDCIWRVPLEAVRVLFVRAAGDYPDDVSFRYDSKKKDYIVTTD